MERPGDVLILGTFSGAREQVNLQGDLSCLRQANQELTRELDLARAHFPPFVNPPSPLPQADELMFSSTLIHHWGSKGSVTAILLYPKHPPKGDKVQHAKWGKTKFLLLSTNRSIRCFEKSDRGAKRRVSSDVAPNARAALDCEKFLLFPPVIVYRARKSRPRGERDER